MFSRYSALYTWLTDQNLSNRNDDDDDDDVWIEITDEGYFALETLI